MKTLILYHEVVPGVFCPDGLISAYVASKAFISPDTLGITYFDRKLSAEEILEQFPDVSEYDHLVIVDYSVHQGVLKALVNQGKKITLIDHHKSALDDLSGFSKNILEGQLNFNGRELKLRLDMQECGATLTWRHFFPNIPMPAFLEYVRDRDLYTKLLPYTEQVHCGLSSKLRKISSIENQFAFLDYISQMSKEDYIEFIRREGGDELHQKKVEKIEAIVNRRGFTVQDFEGYQVPHIFLLKSDESYTSDIGEYLYKKYPQYEFVVLIMSDLLKISLRRSADHTVDLRAIAEGFGGGGHLAAASFRLKEPFKAGVTV